MQPPRPFRGAPYDKDMFSFLPTLSNQDVLVESSRKRKFMASDSQTTISFPTMGYGPFRDLHTGELRGNQSFVPTSSPRESSTFRNHSDYVKLRNQNDSSAPWDSNKRGLYDSRSEWHGYSSFAEKSQSSNHNDSPSFIQSPLGPTYKLNCSPLVTEDPNQDVSHDSNAHMVGEENDLHFRKIQSCELQFSTSTELEGSFSNELVIGESQKLLQNSLKSGVYNVGPNKKDCLEHTYKVGNFSKVELGDSSSFARVDPTKVFGDNVGDSILNLAETNSILQQALKILQASSGAGLTVNQDGSTQGCGGDAINMKSVPTSLTQNLSHSSIGDTLPKGGETGLNLNKSIVSGDKGSVNIDNGLKSENGGSALAEKLWDGTLKLSSTVTVSAVAFFKSGERMPDFSCAGAVEVKGKVRLEAFEKYVQDLPRSRTRGLMVMSLSGKESCSASSLKSVMEVARKYREGRRVGFAELNNGVDMYVCPNSDTVITILAKHGFFKGLTAVSEKSNPLIGCVVWRKNSSSAPATQTLDIDAPTSEQSIGNSDKTQTEIGVVKNSTENKIPETCVGQPEQSMLPENKLTSFSELNNIVETVKPSPSAPVMPNQPILLSDDEDEDLPEYDFGAVICQPSESSSSLTVTVGPAPNIDQFIVSGENKPPILQMRSESSTISQTLTGPHYQGLTRNMNHHLETHGTSTQPQREGCTSLRTSDQGLSPYNKGHQPEMTNPSWEIEEKKPANACSDNTKKQNNVFDDDDDDMPEWCPPDLKKTRPEFFESPRPMPGPRPSMVSGFSFTDLATGRQLPPPPPLPPLPPPSALGQPTTTITDQNHSIENQFSLSPPQPPPLPPSQRPLPPPPFSTRVHFFDKNYPYVPHSTNQAVDTSVPGNPDNNKKSMQLSASAPSHMQFQPTHYPPPPLPPTPHPSLIRARISNNFMHNRPVTPPSHEWFQDQRYPPAPPLTRPPAGKSESHGPENEVGPFPPSNPGFRPQFDGPRPRVNSQSLYSPAWKGSRE